MLVAVNRCTPLLFFEVAADDCEGPVVVYVTADATTKAPDLAARVALAWQVATLVTASVAAVTNALA